VLQMDLTLGCDGHWSLNGKNVTPSRATATVFYPGIAHGYSITAASDAAEICNFKMRIELTWPAVKQRIFPALLHNVPVPAPLQHALHRIARLNVNTQHRPPLLMAALVEVLCLWPREPGQKILSLGARHEIDARLQPALKLLEARPRDPPAIRELAAAAHLSPRHFVRAFQSQLGCTPHEFATARRLERARQLLLQGRISVTQAAEELCFPSIHTFSRWFRRETGLSPQQFRQKPDRF